MVLASLRRALVAPLGLAALLAAPPLAHADRTFPIPAALAGSLRTGGFLVAPPEQVRAPAGDYAAGDFGSLYWCDPYPGTHVQAATIHAYRFHTTTTTARIEIGPTTDGSGGYSVPESQVVAGQTGSQFALTNMNAQCVGARARQTGAQQNLQVGRIWDFFIDGPVTLMDDQGPAVSGPQVSPPGPGGWYTGPLSVTWSQSDNGFLRGSTGARIAGSRGVDLGDLPDGQAQATLDPGPDGRQLVEVYRTGDSWEPAVAQQPIDVDRIPPSPPTLVSTPSGTPAPVIVAATLSVDDLSGLAGYQYSSDAGRNISTAPPVYAIPGVYTTIARAVDSAGNAGLWSAPLTVVVTQPAPPPLAAGAAAASAAATAGVSQPPVAALPDLAGARFSLRFESRPLAAGGAVTVDYGRPAVVSGRLASAQGAGVGGVAISMRNGAGRELASAATDGDGRFALAFRARKPGRYGVVAGGTPGVSARVRVAVRALLSVRPAGLGRDEQGPLVVARSDRMIVLHGRLRPRSLAAGKTVELQYVDGAGGWQLAPVQARADGHGRFALRYRFGLPGSEVRGVMRVVVPHDRGWPLAEAHGRPFRVLVPA